MCSLAAASVSGDIADHGTSDAHVCVAATGQVPRLLQCHLPKGGLVGSVVILSTTLMNNR